MSLATIVAAILLLETASSGGRARPFAMASWHPPKTAGYGWGTWKGCPRLSLGREPCLYGWPSTGGRLTILSPSAFELDYLNVNRFTTSERADEPATEDAFCLQMKRLGATFIQWGRALFIDAEKAAEEIHTILGWPASGGVWVIRETWEALYDRDVGRVKLAKTMEERCRAIEMSGGTFFANPSDCDFTKDLVETPEMLELALRIKDPSVTEHGAR